MKVKIEIDFSDILKAAGISSTEKVQTLTSLDTTGSMYACLLQARRANCSVVDAVSTFPNHEFGFIGHGDYEDEFDADSYCTRQLPFTSDMVVAKRFINELPATFGYDADECYERVMAEALEYPWDPQARKLFIMFGDANPHSPSFRYNKKRYDWRSLAPQFKEREIDFIAVQCLNRAGSTAFYRDAAQLAGGVHARLNRFEHVEATILASLGRVIDTRVLDLVQEHVSTQLGGLSYDLADIFSTLAGRGSVAREVRHEDLQEIDSARFQGYRLKQRGRKQRGRTPFLKQRGRTPFLDSSAI